MTTTPTLEPSGPVQPATKGRSLLRRLLTHPQAVLCVVFLLFVVFLGLSSSWLAPHGQNVTDLSAVNASPFSSGHLLGADSTGRDILSRLMYGTRQTMIACLVVLAVSLVIGVTSGLAAGFYRGRTDAVSSWFSDVVMSMPGIVLIIALYARTGSNIVATMAAYGLIVAPRTSAWSGPSSSGSAANSTWTRPRWSDSPTCGSSDAMCCGPYAPRSSSRARSSLPRRSASRPVWASSA